MKSKRKSILLSLFLIVTVLTFLSLTAASLATPNLAKEIKKDIERGTSGLCKGDIKNYYNIYNTRKLTEIEKTKFYERIIESQDIVNSEKDLFKKYNLKIQIKNVSIIKKINSNMYLCNISVNYRYRKNHNTTDLYNQTEDYIVKIIDVGDMDFKILLPFNSLDKDFYCGHIFKILKEEHHKKEAEKIKLEREEEKNNQESNEYINEDYTYNIEEDTNNDDTAGDDIASDNTDNDNLNEDTNFDLPQDNLDSENTDNTVEDNTEENLEQ